MKNKKTFFILLGIFAVCFIGASTFFALQGISAANKKQEYFDVYRAQAEEYIKSSVEIKNKYGEDVSVQFDNSVTYKESGNKGSFDRYIEIFSPHVPETIEEFTNEIELITFKVRINGDLYEITFEKGSAAELVVTNFTEAKQ